jgi:Asp-tRNA(Asn)/Glu-tRNA(Gln) amidotransferase A subunit family amidase
MKKRLKLIAKYEPSVKAFVPGTFVQKKVNDDYEKSKILNRSTHSLARTLFGIKDIINVDGYQTACGSNLPTELFSGPQASSVTKLLKAGAVMVGKTVTSEFAISDPGFTRNPRNLAHTPGGSSSGSAAAVAAGFCDIALGTQTSGSIIRPAGFCGVIGYKPTFGRIPTDGVLSFSESMDHVGLMASDLDVLEKTLKVIVEDWSKILQPQNENYNLGVPLGSYIKLADSEITSQYFGIVEKLNCYPYKVKNLTLIKDICKYNDEMDELIHAELYDVHAKWLKRYRDDYRALSLKSIEAGENVKNERLIYLKEKANTYSSWIQSVMREEKIDLWVAPTAPTVAPLGLSNTGDFKMASIWSYTGLPVVCLPTGVNTNNLPYSIQIIGKHGEDELLLKHAKNIQRTIGELHFKNFWEI